MDFKKVLIENRKKNLLKVFRRYKELWWKTGIGISIKVAGKVPSGSRRTPWLHLRSQNIEIQKMEM